MESLVHAIELVDQVEDYGHRFVVDSETPREVPNQAGSCHVLVVEQRIPRLFVSGGEPAGMNAMMEKLLLHSEKGAGFMDGVAFHRLVPFWATARKACSISGSRGSGSFTFSTTIRSPRSPFPARRSRVPVFDP